jgi:putative hydrolase of the HAD superfamily
VGGPAPSGAELDLTAAIIRGSVNVRAVFFDAGETLVYPHPSFAELFAEVLRENGHAVDPARTQEVVSATSERFAETLQSERGRLWSTSPERSRTFWLEAYRMFLTEVGVDADHEVLADALYRRFRDLSSYRLHPDAVPTLERLSDLGIGLGLISNFEDWLEQLLESLEVTRYFSVMVISGAEGVEKPDPRIFQIALRRAGVAAEDSAYVGDHPFFDVQAAREVGMLPVLIDRRGRHPDVDALRITSLEDLPAALGLGS